MVVFKEVFGDFTDPETGATQPVYRYRLIAAAQGGAGIEVHLLSYGASLVGVLAPDSSGHHENLVLGFDSMEGYLANPYQGSVVGRYANRIKEGRFQLSGQQHQLTINNQGNHLHGGVEGWSHRVWSSSVVGEKVVFSLVSREGDQGYPGTVMAQASYHLSALCELHLELSAVSSAATPINLTNHAYFNLAGHASGRQELVRHTCQLQCDRYLPVAADVIPTGEQRAVDGTGYDLLESKLLDTALSGVQDGGYDHCFVLQDTNRGTLRLAATLRHPPSGRALKVSTTEPGVQFYTSNFLPEQPGELVGRGGCSYTKQGAFACEPQNFPDAPNQESFPNSILNPGDTYRHTIVYSFSCDPPAQYPAPPLL